MITPPNYKNYKHPNAKVRLSGLDIVRTIACVSVIASHFFLFSDFQKVPFDSPGMFFQGMLSSLMIGSDLYMILTGYLCMNKTFGKNFYLGGIKVLLSYVFFSLLTIILCVYVFHNGMTWKSGLLGILGFNTIPYAWYIEMWIGLYLLVPFLNIWYKAIPSKRYKLILILFLFLLTAPADFLNRYGLHLWPGFWKNIFPLMFYFIGCYLREYQPNFNRLILGVLILGLLLVGPVFNSFVNHPTYMYIIGGRSGIIVVPLAILIFACFYNYNLKNNICKFVFKAISLRSLDIFLCSATLDSLLYPWFRQHFFITQSQYTVFYFIIVLTVFLSAYLIASFKRILFIGLQKLIHPSFLLQNKG